MENELLDRMNDHCIALKREMADFRRAQHVIRQWERLQDELRHLERRMDERRESDHYIGEYLETA